MKNCCIEGCVGPSKNITYFEFPTSRLLRKRWLDAINPPAKLSADALVCSRHFATGDYEDVRGKVRLKGKVVPCIFEAQNPKQILDPLSLPGSNVAAVHPQESSDRQTTNNDNHNGKSDSKNVDNDNGKIDNGKGNNDKTTNNTDNDNLKCSKDKTELHNENSDSHNEKVDENVNEKELRVVNEKIVNEKTVNDNGNVDSDKVGSKRVAENTVSKRVKKKWVPMRQRVKLNGQTSEDSSSQDSVNSDLPPPPVLEDLEEHLPNYQIANMKTERQLAAMAETLDPVEQAAEAEEIVVEPHLPVFIELSVGQDNTSTTEANDCLMVVESVQCDVDPTLMLEARAEEDDCTEHIDLDDEEDVPVVAEDKKPPADPISLLTSSDEDDVILQEPHIDTLSVSSVTDEDDLPLQKLIKKEKKSKKSKKKKKPEAIKSILIGVTDFFCMHCQHVSLSRSAHEKHVKTHLKEQGTTKVYQICKECGFTTSSKSQLMRHQRKHLNEKRFKCPLCSYRSKYNMSLMYHLKTHHLDPNVFNCSACGLQCDCRKTLVEHQRSCFEDGGRFSCSFCGYEARTKRTLKMHKKSVHKVNA